MDKKKICILGSTGSIGRNTLKVISGLGDRFQVCGLSADSNAGLLARQADIFKPSAVAIRGSAGYRELLKKISGGVRIYEGPAGIDELAAMKEADVVVVAISGTASIRPAYAAVKAGKDLGLASKEALVSAGHLITREAKRSRASIIPVDSEHSAIFQCLAGQDMSAVRRLYITGSGGPLWSVPKKNFAGLSPKQVLDHPKWKMGKKISVDSATMMNKGLEIIEAKWLFGVGIDMIRILIHREAIVHSMVEFIDGSVLAQMGITDMRLPIQYALSYPERLPSNLKALDLAAVKNLTFQRPDMDRFPALRLAYKAAKKEGSVPAALNSANEYAVRAFLAGEIKFTDITSIIERVLSLHKRIDFPSLDDIEWIERWVREEVERYCSK